MDKQKGGSWMRKVKRIAYEAAVIAWDIYIGLALCAIWVLGMSPLNTGQDIAMAVFTAIVQGILVAGLSTYINQVVKQANKAE